MELTIIAIYCWVDYILKYLDIKDDVRQEMSNAEVITTLMVAVQFFSGNIERARQFLKEYGYIPNMLSKSRFNRRQHALGVEMLTDMQKVIGEILKLNNPEQEYAVDSFPVPCCQNIRIFRSKIYQGKEYRGYTASKKQYFYGLKVHVVVTMEGMPVEFMLTPGSWSDCKVLKELDLDLPEGAVAYADKAYNDYEYEDALKEAGIELAVQRKANSKRPHSGCKAYLINAKRKIVETVISGITGFMPRKIHAVTAAGFAMKVALFTCAPCLRYLASCL